MSVPNMAMMLYDAIWCYIMLYESIRTPPLVLVGRQTRWTWTSSAKKKQTQNSLQRFFSRKIQSNIYNDIIVFVFFPFRVAWLHQSTNLAISRKTLEERFHLSFSEFRMSWDSQGLQNSYGSVKGMAFQRLRASWSTPEWVHCGPPCKQSMCAWCWMDFGWMTFLIFPLILMLPSDAAIWCCHLMLPLGLVFLAKVFPLQKALESFEKSAASLYFK